MNNTYVSSIIAKYGDIPALQADLKTLQDIAHRQGTSLLIDSLAEFVGKAALRFKLSESDCARIRESLLTELREALLERT